MPNVSIFEPIVFTDTFDLTPKIGTLEDTLNLVESILSHHYDSFFEDRVSFSETMTREGFGIMTGILSDSLTLADEFLRTPPQTIDEFLFIYDWLELPNGLLYDTVVFSDTFSGEGGPGVTDTLTLTETLDYELDAVPETSDELALVDAFSGVVNDRWRPVVSIPEERS